MGLFKYGLIVGLVAIGLWTLFQKFEPANRKPTAVVFAQKDINTEFHPLMKPSLQNLSNRSRSESRALEEGTRTNHHGTRVGRLSKEEQFHLMRDPLPARGPLTTAELALELEFARLNELRAQSQEANRLVGDIMRYFEKIKGTKKISKNFSNLPTDLNGQAIVDDNFGEQMIDDKNVLGKWKRLMAISHQQDAQVDALRAASAD